MTGWLAIKRGIHDHPLFKKQPERLFVWTWMLSTAAWKETRQDAGGKIVTVKRGQILTSYRQISDATGVGVKVIRNLIERLEGEHAIDTDTGTGRLLVTIRNYEKYQSHDDDEGTAEGTRGAQQGHTKEQENKDLPSEAKASSGRDAPPEQIEVKDPAKIMFDSGIRILREAGKSENSARAILGKWRGEHGAAAVISALSSAQREGAIDPVSFIEGCLRRAAKDAAAAQPQRRRAPEFFGRIEQ